MPLKLLIMIDSLTCGGAEKSLVSLLPFLTARGYDITLMTRGGGLFSRYVPDSVRRTMLDTSPGRLRRLHYSLSIRLGHRHPAETHWETIGRHLPEYEETYDVAIAYQQGFPTFFIADKVRAARKICWVNVDLSAAGYDPEYCRDFYRKYDRIVPVSDILMDNFGNQGFSDEKSKFICCYDILNEELIRTMSRQEPCPPTFGSTDIVTVGRLVPQKGYDLAIDAAAILKKEKGPGFRWHFVGGGPLEGHIRKRIEKEGLADNVILEGTQPNPYPYIANADIYVQTSIFEGFGLTVGEAKILGRPIVSTDFPVIYNQITHEKNGLVVKMDGRAIADGIIRIADDRKLRETITGNLALEHNTTAMTESEKVIRMIENS